MSLTFAQSTGYIRTGELSVLWKNCRGVSDDERKRLMRELIRMRSGGTRGVRNFSNRRDRVTWPRIF